MKRLKKYLINCFLPSWCRIELMAENEKLRKTVSRQEVEIARLNAYIDGLTAAMRGRQPKIYVNGGERK